MVRLFFIAVLLHLSFVSPRAQALDLGLSIGYPTILNIDAGLWKFKGWPMALEASAMCCIWSSGLELTASWIASDDSSISHLIGLSVGISNFASNSFYLYLGPKYSAILYELLHVEFGLGYFAGGGLDNRPFVPFGSVGVLFRLK